jgi:hypothetical protein
LVKRIILYSVTVTLDSKVHNKVINLKDSG